MERGVDMCVAIMAIWTCRSVVAVVSSSRAVSLSPWLDLCIPRGVPTVHLWSSDISAIVASSDPSLYSRDLVLTPRRPCTVCCLSIALTQFRGSG